MSTCLSHLKLLLQLLVISCESVPFPGQGFNRGNGSGAPFMQGLKFALRFSPCLHFLLELKGDRPPFLFVLSLVFSVSLQYII